MKILCDDCNREAATLFCCADEAALCEACNLRVHHANKLAGKHQCFSLHQPSSSTESPLCDICKEKRGFLFCQEDRAILCRDCDILIHTANDLTAKHNRFFLTGIKLVAPSLAEPPVVESAIKSVGPVVQPAKGSPVAVVPDNGNEQSQIDGTTSISDYLIKAIPGWHVEELLDNVGSGFTDLLDFSSVNGLFKADEILQYTEPNFVGDFGYGDSVLHTQLFQVPNVPVPAQNFNADMHGFKRSVNMKSAQDQRDVSHLKVHMLYTDDAFTVPQIGPSPKRARWG